MSRALVHAVSFPRTSRTEAASARPLRSRPRPPAQVAATKQHAAAKAKRAAPGRGGAVGLGASHERRRRRVGQTRSHPIGFRNRRPHYEKSERTVAAQTEMSCWDETDDLLRQLTLEAERCKRAGEAPGDKLKQAIETCIAMLRSRASTPAPPEFEAEAAGAHPQEQSYFCALPDQRVLAVLQADR